MRYAKALRYDRAFAAIKRKGRRRWLRNRLLIMPVTRFAKTREFPVIVESPDAPAPANWASSKRVRHLKRKNSFP